VIARTAAALGVAGRWCAITSLALTAGAFIRPAGADALPRGLLAAIVVAGAVQVFLAFRIEFDRVIFEAASSDTAAFERFDQALAAIGLARPRSARLPEERAAGLWRLVKSSGLLLGLQFALATAVVWVSP